ncbi:hypothetical protein ANCCEY_13895 [Ancylostoma ceylanicum]|uniref:Mos1 transposase HTH domain-containing protein n=1 Tax=Ancylostoma ceylanicum TaxID=53326 RepID=A0A0D6L616_9BILA|nr:hypothetical protein ANCCEY_13895 [Ancylostoma ceylanicum]
MSACVSPACNNDFDEQIQIRTIVYYEFLQGHRSRLFQYFESGDISLENRPLSGRPTDCNDEALRDALREKHSTTTRELSMTLGCSRTTIIRHLQTLGYRKLMSIWVPHKLSASQLAARVRGIERRKETLSSRKNMHLPTFFVDTATTTAAATNSTAVAVCVRLLLLCSRRTTG